MASHNVNLPLKTVTDRIQSCRAVLWAIETHGDRLAELLDERMAPPSPEGPPASFAVQVGQLAEELKRSRDRMVETDRAYRDQRAREIRFRSARNRAVQGVNDDLVGFRRFFVGVYGVDKVDELGFARRVPQRPEELLEQATHLATSLGAPDIDLSGALYREVEIADASGFAQQLSGSVEKLRIAVDELVREVRQTEAMKLAKDETLDAHNQTFLWIARTVESLFQLVGLRQVAQRIRPSQRRAGTLLKKFEELAESTEGESTDPAGEAAEGADETPESPESDGPPAARPTP